MLAVVEKKSSETFIVWNDDINLVGALISSKNGSASASGTIKFKNGKKIAFFSEMGNRDILHQRLTRVCRHIAEFYNTNVIRSKDNKVEATNDTSVLLKKILPLLN